MKLSRVLFCGFLLTGRLACPLGAAGANADWPAWRGPTGDGQAAADQTAPVKWSETENVIWRAPIRGRGHSSPTVVGNRVYLTTADTATGEQLVLCLDRATGRPVWETVVHRGNLDTAGHRNTSQASATVAWDGECLYINFLNEKAVHTTALDPAGKIVWQQRVSDYVTHQGFGASPVIYQSVVLVTADHKGGGKVAGLDKRTGKIVWQHDRPKTPNYTSPAVVTAAGRAQMVFAGCNLVSSYEPLTGRKLWEIAGATEECVVTAVTDGSRVFVGGGYPKNNTTAVEADGSGKIAWQNGTRVYVPSMLVRDGHLFAVLDNGQAVCLKSDTGEERWREKVDKDFYASPVMVGSLIYATSLRGMTSVFEATPERFNLVAQNQLGDEAYASPVICGNRIYLRSAKKGESRPEFLWCIGEK
ncbi:MAG: serine/threonine protein kinase [Opitutus sp.]|nr:serine/threonine protein kinase [Opitutus sp.]